MAASTPTPDRSAPATNSLVDLRSPLLAAVLALILPGLGHLYQRRTGKGVLFAVCILGTYFYGWYVGGGKVVYAAMQPASIRNLYYFAQVWVGLPAWPAMIQSTLGAPLGPNFMTPPHSRGGDDGSDEFADWNRTFNSNFELGTVLTAVAGLLNVLAIFDAAAGPVGSTVEEDEDEDEEKASKKAVAIPPP